MRGLALLVAVFSTLIACGEPKPQTKISEMYVDARSGLRMRAKPNLKAKRIATIPYGAKIVTTKVFGQEFTAGGRTGKWHEVLYGGKTGWVFGGFLTGSRPAFLPVKGNLKKEIIRLFESEKITKVCSGNNCDLALNYSFAYGKIQCALGEHRCRFQRIEQKNETDRAIIYVQQYVEDEWVDLEYDVPLRAALKILKTPLPGKILILPDSAR